jgi:hypothetical protein
MNFQLQDSQETLVHHPICNLIRPDSYDIAMVNLINIAAAVSLMMAGTSFAQGAGQSPNMQVNIFATDDCETYLTTFYPESTGGGCYNYWVADSNSWAIENCYFNLCTCTFYSEYNCQGESQNTETFFLENGPCIPWIGGFQSAICTNS